MLQVEEDYHGFYDPRLLDGVLGTLEDMLVEAAPRPFQDEEVGGPEAHGAASPVWLLNEAWRVFCSDPVAYPDWERRATGVFLS